MKLYTLDGKFIGETHTYPINFTGFVEEWTKYWYLNGKFHRTAGPAVEYASGAKRWFANGRFHRLDGPAVEYSNGAKEWWVNGKNIDSKEEYDLLVDLMKLKGLI